MEFPADAGFFLKMIHKNMQNDRFFLLLYYSFLCNFTSIYVFFLEICKKYIKYALKFLLKLLLTISLWRIIPISYAVYFYFTLYFIEGARKKESRLNRQNPLPYSECHSHCLSKNSRFFLISSHRCATHSTERPGSSGVWNT